MNKNIQVAFDQAAVAAMAYRDARDNESQAQRYLDSGEGSYVDWEWYSEQAKSAKAAYDAASENLKEAMVDNADDF